MSESIIDNNEVEEIMAKLETLEDEEMAVKYLREFNEVSSQYGQLLMNYDHSLEHEKWKQQCDDAGKKVRKIINKILGL